MKRHTNEFKEQIKTLGRELKSKITYTIGGVETVLSNEQLNAVTPSFEGNILKSVMKRLDIDSNVYIETGTEIKYEFGLKVEEEFEYVNFGNYIVYEIEKQEDTNSYKIVCYDKMLYTMLDYTQLSITFPVTIRDYIKGLCLGLGFNFANENDEFANYDKVIETDVFLDSEGNNIGYTFRDVFDQLAEVTASTICLNENDEIEVRYINDTGDTIDEEFLKNINVNFGEKFGPVNSIVLSRSAQSDNVFLQDEQSVETNGLCEIKIIDNQIMNDNNRSDYLPDILEKLNGLEYYANDFASTGIVYYDLCDRYNVEIGENVYSCIMFNNELLVTQGMEENVFTEIPEQTETDYKKADKTDRKINQAYIIVDKQNQTINAVVSKQKEQTEEFAKISLTTEGLQTTVTETIEKQTEIDNDLQTYKTTVSTEFVQKKDSFEMKFKEQYDTEINDLNTDNQENAEKLNTISNFIRFQNGAIILGEEGSSTKLVLEKDIIYFNNKETTLENGKMKIANAVVVDELQVANWAWSEESDGTFNLDYVGSDT